MYVYILRSKCGKTPEMFSIKRVRFVILTRKGISIIAIAPALAATDKIYVCGVRNTYLKGNIDNSKSALAATDKIYVYILRSKCGETLEMFSIKRLPL